MAAGPQPGAERVCAGGATATDNTLEDLFLIPGSGISPGRHDRHLPRRRHESWQPRGIFCRARFGVITGVAANTPVAFHKESIGGSSNGTVPLGSPLQQNLQFFNMAVANTCTNQGTQSLSLA